METDNAARRDFCRIRQVTMQAIALLLRFVKWPVRLRLFRQRTIFCPTLAGSFCIVAVLVILIVACLNQGESYLALSHRLPADILIVEGWIGRKGLRAAVDEFERAGYRYLVASGGLTSGRWEDRPESYAEMASRELIRLGVPKEKIIIASSANTESHRTFEAAVAVWRTLRDAGIKPTALNVFTDGPHARRSALVFSKVFSHGVKVGVIGWIAPEAKTGPWWRSSDRSRELLDETVGYLFEVLLNSGRCSNSPRETKSADSVQHAGSAIKVVTSSLR
jgi:uncharacterized SAM-binding protein YcdF (DUF218 family)